MKLFEDFKILLSIIALDHENKVIFKVLVRDLKTSNCKKIF